MKPRSSKTGRKPAGGPSVDRKRLARLREEVYRANMDLVERGLVVSTFGNVSGIDREMGLIAIKPSGVDYGKLSPANMVACASRGHPAAASAERRTTGASTSSGT